MEDSGTTEAERFLALLRPIERELEVYCRRLAWDAQDVPDALQNAIMHAVSAFDRYHEGTNFRAWMFKILTHEAFSFNRRHSRRAQHEFQVEPDEIEALAVGEAPSGEPSPGVSAEWTEAVDDRILAALRTLTDNERAVLLLRSLEGLRYREIGDLLEIPIGSVMGHLSRARQKMRAALHVRGWDAPTRKDL